MTDDLLLVFDHNRNRAKYEEISSGSSIYPGRGTIQGLAYVSLKLTGELAELSEATTVDNIVKECGDVLWYLGAMHRELEVTVRETGTVDAEAEEFGKPPVNPDLIALIAGGKLGEVVGKAMRDSDGEIDATARAMILNYMGSIYVCVGQYLNLVNVKMSDCMMVNLEKLRDRTMRDTLHGSGDDR